MNRREGDRGKGASVPATSLWSVYLQYLAWEMAAANGERRKGKEKRTEKERRNEYVDVRLRVGTQLRIGYTT